MMAAMLAAAVVLVPVGALPSGASTLACVDMVPRHLQPFGDGIIAPQESISPYGVTAAVKAYAPGGTVSGKTVGTSRGIFRHLFKLIH